MPFGSGSISVSDGSIANMRPLAAESAVCETNGGPRTAGGRLSCETGLQFGLRTMRCSGVPPQEPVPYFSHRRHRLTRRERAHDREDRSEVAAEDALAGMASALKPAAAC